MEYKHALTLAYAWQQKTLRSADNENEAIFADMRICSKDELTWRIHLACHQLAALKQIKSCFRKRTMRAEKGRTTKGTDHLMLLAPRLAQSSHSWSIWPHKLRNKLIIRELWTLFLIRWENIYFCLNILWGLILQYAAAPKLNLHLKRKVLCQDLS